MNEFIHKAVKANREALTVVALLKPALVFLAYFLTAWGGLALNTVSGFATLVWPPTGIALVALLVWGYRIWPAVFFAALFVNLMTGAPMFVALGIATGNTLEAVVGVFLLRRFGFDPDLETTRDGLLFKVFGALFNTLISATIGVSSLWLGGLVLLTDYPETWFAWWIGDMLGALIVGNFLLGARKLFLKRKNIKMRIAETFVYTGVLVIFCVIVFLSPRFFLIPYTTTTVSVYLTLPLLVWAALRFGAIGASFAIFTVSAIAVLGTTLGIGPFVGGALSHNLTTLQIFMGSIAVTIMMLATAVEERTRSAERTKEVHPRPNEVSPVTSDETQKSLGLQRPSNVSIFGKLSLILFGFLFIIGILLSLNYFGMQTLSSIRAYVGGEGLWSKAQKDAAYQLHVYALSGDESDFAQYERLISVPLGDKKARLELEKPVSDLDVADRGFLEGKNSPEDVRNMSLLFKRFRNIHYMDKAIAIWEEGDARIAMLTANAEVLHQLVRSGVGSEDEIRKVLADIDAINSGLTAVEDDFSFTLGEAARWLTGVLIISMLIVAILLIVPVTVTSYLIIRNVARLDRAKTEFISLTSHQLRTPPTGIKWYAGMLLDGDVGTLNDDQRRYLEEIANNNQRMIDVVNSVLNISQIELGVFQNKPVPTDMCALIDKIIAELDFQVRDKEITLTRRLECGTQPILIDPILIRIVIQNLLVNAVKYTPRKGEIALAADVVGTRFSLTIADSGRGIPKHDVQNIFQKFFRASNMQGPETRGIGLGLYVAKRILDQMGGSISFRSELDKGTTFFVSIPIQARNT